MPTTRQYYQEGTVERVARAKGPDAWVFRWREAGPDGARVQKKKVIGDLERYPNLASAKRAVENLRSKINGELDRSGKVTVAELWGHFQANELYDAEIDRSPTTIELYLDNLRIHILPRWGKTFLVDVKAVQVELWLRSIKGAPSTKAKLRSHLSMLFNHAIRHELFVGMNPITTVRQGSKRVKTPDILTIDEMKTILSRIAAPEHRLMILIAAVTACRRSEIRGLKWRDFDYDKLWVHFRQGKVRKHQTKLKTEQSRKRLTISQDLADAMIDWRRNCLYRADEDWVFASPTVGGREPMWLDNVLENYIRPAATAAGITKLIGWHTFRRSVSSALAEAGTTQKVVSDLLRHANMSTTFELYQQSSPEAKRAAQEHMKALFAA